MKLLYRPGNIVRCLLLLLLLLWFCLLELVADSTLQNTIFCTFLEQ